MFPVRARWQRVPRCGAVLLEVVLSMGLLVTAMAFVGYQINAALSVAHATDLRTRALMLVDTKMAELDAGVLHPAWTGDDLKGYFGIAYPGYSWRMRVKPAEIPNLFLVTLEVGFNEYQVQPQLENPEMEIHIDDQGTQVLRTVYRLVPKPADVNVQRDFGLSQEELDAIISAASAAGDANAGSGSDIGGGLAGGGGGQSGGGGNGNVNDQMMAQLTKLIQALVSGGLDPNNINPRDLAQYLDADTLDALGPFIDGYFGNGLDPSMLPGPLQNPMFQQLLQQHGPKKPPANPNQPDKNPTKPPTNPHTPGDPKNPGSPDNPRDPKNPSNPPRNQQPPKTGGPKT